MALTISSMTGWLSCGRTWCRGFVMWAGILVTFGFLLFLPEGGPAAVFGIAARNGEFSLGSADFDFTRPTIPVSIIYG
jgi:hypothetical protein